MHEGIIDMPGAPNIDFSENLDQDMDRQTMQELTERMDDVLASRAQETTPEEEPPAEAHQRRCEVCDRMTETQPCYGRQICEVCIRTQTCSQCNTVAPSQDDMSYVEEEDSYYCNDCVDYCDHHEMNTISDTYETVGGNNVCTGCIDEYYLMCTTCDRYVYSDDSSNYIPSPGGPSQIICQDCIVDLNATYQPILESYIPPTDDLISIVTGVKHSKINEFITQTRIRDITRYTQIPEDVYVTSSVSRSYLEASGQNIVAYCARGHSTTQLHYSNGVDGFCHHCQLAMDTIRRGIREKRQKRGPGYTNIMGYHHHNYSQNDFHHMAKDIKTGNTMYFGIELETSFNTEHISKQTGEDRAKKILQELKGTFVGERDGTVPNGAELISKPMTYSYLTSKTMTRRLEKALTRMQELGSVNGTYNGIGLHIHVSRMPFKSDTKAVVEMEDDMNWFVNCFKDYVQILARRKETSHCRFPITNIEKPVTVSRMYIDKRVLKKGSHGYALNLKQSRTPTYEFRMFNSTQNIEHLIASIEFVRNLSLYVINEPTIIGATFKDVIDYRPTIHLAKYTKQMVKEYPETMKGWNRVKLKDELEIK